MVQHHPFHPCLLRDPKDQKHPVVHLVHSVLYRQYHPCLLFLLQVRLDRKVQMVPFPLFLLEDLKGHLGQKVQKDLVLPLEPLRSNK
jgi:hypothetical protein